MAEAVRNVVEREARVTTVAVVVVMSAAVNDFVKVVGVY